MKRRKKPDRNFPIGKLVRVKDFLPPPDQLFIPERKVKITISLGKDSVDFLKKEAKKKGMPYQRMIRVIVDKYVHHHFAHAKNH